MPSDDAQLPVSPLCRGHAGGVMGAPAATQPGTRVRLRLLPCATRGQRARTGKREAHTAHSHFCVLSRSRINMPFFWVFF